MNRIYTAFLLSGIFLLMSMAACETQNQDKSHGNAEHEEEYNAGLPLIYQMSFLQLYSEKLYLAGEAGNRELADMYAHEIEEISEMLIKEEVTYEGMDIGGMTETMLLPALEKVEAGIDSGDPDSFREAYTNLIQSCNSCHSATGHAFIKVTVPDRNRFNQEFSAQ